MYGDATDSRLYRRPFGELPLRDAMTTDAPVKSSRPRVCVVGTLREVVGEIASPSINEDLAPTVLGFALLSWAYSKVGGFGPIQVVGQAVGLPATKAAGVV
jgi:hypothetical protein